MEDDRRKRLFYRCHHRGCRELDIILGSFARRHLASSGASLGASLGASDCALLEAFLEHSEPEILDWLLHRLKAPVPYRPLVSLIVKGQPPSLSERE